MKSKITKHSKRILTLPNVLGLILATLILFEVKLDMKTCRFINSPLGMVVAAIIVISLFVFVHPIVGILLVVYLYENVKHMNKLFNPAIEQRKSSFLKHDRPTRRPSTFLQHFKELTNSNCSSASVSEPRTSSP